MNPHPPDTRRGDDRRERRESSCLASVQRRESFPGIGPTDADKRCREEHGGRGWGRWEGERGREGGEGRVEREGTWRGRCVGGGVSKRALSVSGRCLVVGGRLWFDNYHV